MGTFTDKVDALTGRTTAQTERDLALLEAAAQVYADLGDSTIEAIADRKEIPDGGLDVSSSYLAGVVSEQGRAFEIDPSRKDDFKYGERTRPVYYVEANTVYRQPDTVTCDALVLDLPTTTTEAESTGTQMQVLLALQTAIHLLNEKMATIQEGVAEVSGLPTVPTPPADPTISYTNASAVAPTSTSIGNLPTAPTLDDSDFNTWRDKEDVEMMQGLLEEAQATVQTDLQEYQAKVKKEINQAQITAQEAAQTAEQETQVDLKNKAQQLQADVQAYSAELEQYSAELQKAKQEANQIFQEVQTDVQQKQQQLRMISFDIKRIRRRYRRTITSFRKMNRSRSPIRIVPGEY